MKKQLLLLALLISFGAKAQLSGWLQQSVPYNYEGYIQCLSVVDANVVWGNTWEPLVTASPYTRDFVRTVDGGTTWTFGTITAAPAAWAISNIYGIDANNAFVAMFNASAAGGRVYRTTDGGATWAQVGTNMFTAATSFANVVYFWDAQNGMAMGDPIGNPLKYEIWLTSDGGTTWTAVPAANLPALTNAAEYGITNLYDHADGRVWFGTTYGDIYGSSDGGNTWTKSVTGLPAYTTAGGGRQDITDVVFTDSLNGMAVQANATSYIIAQTTDGGTTWTTLTPSGTFFPGDVAGVPGVAGGYVCVGSNATFGFGSSMSTDFGATWTTIDTNVSHTSVDFAGPGIGWTGEYIPASTPGGAYKFYTVTPLACGDPSITPGLNSINDTLICENETLTVTATGVVGPTTGTYAGYGWVFTTGDITGSTDPLNVAGGGAGVTAATGFSFPTPASITFSLINDGLFFGVAAPYGVYYLTPVIFGNAIAANPPPAFLFDLTLDPLCTYTGNSVMFNIVGPGDPLCPVGISEINADNMSVFAYMKDASTMDLQINALKNEKANVEIYDLTGRVVYNNNFTVVQGVNHQLINVNALNAGTYIVKASAGSAKAVNKLVKL